MRRQSTPSQSISVKISTASWLFIVAKNKRLATHNGCWKKSADSWADPPISPSFYPSKVKSGEVVPTWDYAVVHASGTLRFIEDAQWLRSFVAGLTHTHEMPRAQPWKIEDAPAAYIDKMLKLIVGFEFSIANLSGKWKVSQNRPHADRQGVMQNLQDAGDADSREIADMLASRDSDVPVAR